MSAYLNFVGANWVLNSCSNPNLSPSGELPMLRDGTRPIAGVANIFAHLKTRGLDLDAHLTAEESAHCISYIALIEDRLYDALLQDRVKRRLKAYRMMLDQDGQAVNEVYLMARDCFKALADKLGDQKYFLGDLPTSLDAVAYGHLAIHAIPSLTNPRLFSLLTFEFPTLIAYISRIQEHLFSTPPQPSPHVVPAVLLRDVMSNPSSYFARAWEGVVGFVGRINRNVEEDKKESQDGESEERKLSPQEEAIRAERRDTFFKIVSVVGAVAFFVGYIVKNGIVQISVVDEEEEVVEEDQEVDEETEKERQTEGADENVIYLDEEGNVVQEDDAVDPDEE
ncbi:metaxin 1 [Blyttiomyces sp. JEL0837]|nr:metaxin 1 [Blyttiomyces sp. JEL0837]